MNNSNELSTFNFNSNEIRVVTIDNEPWFVAVDLYDVLYGKRTGLNTAKLLAADEIRVAYRHRKQPSDLSSLGQLFVGTRVSHFALISESGLYKLVMRSDKPEAKEFQNWVTRVVLPAIRKDGAYIMGEEKVASGEMDEDEFILKAMNILQSKIERLKKENELQAQTITDMKPAATVGR